MQNSLKRMWASLGLLAAIAAVLSSTATAAHKAVNIVIWTDSDRATAVTKVANDWAAKSGATVKVVTKNFGDIRDNLATVTAADAPDVEDSRSVAMILATCPARVRFSPWRCTR